MQLLQIILQDNDKLILIFVRLHLISDKSCFFLQLADYFFLFTLFKY
jgi:hypothetical protein